MNPMRRERLQRDIRNCVAFLTLCAVGFGAYLFGYDQGREYQRHSDYEAVSRAIAAYNSDVQRSIHSVFIGIR